MAHWFSIQPLRHLIVMSTETLNLHRNCTAACTDYAIRDQGATITMTTEYGVKGQ